MTDTFPSPPPPAPLPLPTPPKKRSSAWWLFGCFGVLVLGFFGVVGLAASQAGGGGIDDAAVLKMSLSGSIPEFARPDGLSELLGQETMTVLDYRANLKKAAADKRIKGVLLRVEPLLIGWAKVEELRDALDEFKKSGKFIVAYSEYMGEKEYALTLAADEIIMPPDSPFQFDGIATEVSHYPGLLEKLGIEVQYFRFGKYKSVSGEAFGRKALTEPVKEMINDNLDRVFGHFVDAVAKYRKLDAEKVRALIDDGHLKANWAFDNKLIDKLAYWDEVETSLKGRLKVDEKKSLPTVSSAKYKRVSPSSAGLKEGKHTIGLVFSQGLIVAGKGGTDPFSGDDSQGATPIIQALRAGAEDDDVKAIVFRVDSPGGAGMGCDYVRREVEKARLKKPVIVSMSDVAASGGYWVSMAATAIVAQPTTATGSIGIFSVVPSLEGTYEKLGLNHEVFRRGAHADALIGTRKMTEEEAKRFDDDLHASYNRFVELAAKGRGKSFDEMEPLAQGRTWYGDKALELGLIDKLGGFDVAFALAKEKAGLPVDELVKVKLLEKKKGVLAELLKGDHEDEESSGMESALLRKVVEASGYAPLLRSVPGLGAFAQQVLQGRETMFPLMEYRLDER